MASTQRSQCSEGSGRQEEEGSTTSQDMNVPQILRSVLLNDKLHKLVSLLFQKYQKKEQITMEEMLHVVDNDYHERFPLIFRELCECMCLGLGIEMRAVDPSGQTYELLPVLGLTYNGILDEDDQIIAKVDLLILILSVIFIKGNRVSEDDLRKQVIKWEILAQMEHIVFGDPWKFITEDLVREEYLGYQQVPNSDPALHEFLWGPRTHDETSKMKILEHVAKLNRVDPRSYPHLYAEALKEENNVLLLQLLCRLYQDNKIAKLLPILLFKYQEEEPITKAEMLHHVQYNYQEHFPQIFKAVCECMSLAFGIDIREVDPPGQIYVLLPVLGLTYNGILVEDYQSISKINLLVVILIVIFLKGNRISEEDARELLRTRGMLPQREHFVIGDPWEFIRKDLVQVQYLEYRQVPNSNPARYEFLWGPRAKAETSKMKVLEHLAKVNKRDPRSYTHLYEEALREESEAAHS
ncbi:Melanoma-associated antigen 10 [Fukomys damarensis]|uniref:Melanoma-associated antigen 10 n=1 Tax=Fukomys damarensis TaxID=885580 RepID=A0A091DY97_FUKDA|nr:Melanoma-associated antigen 10 [Fukomys damarensis]